MKCPSLPGCISQGATREEALANIRDAIQQYIASLIDDGEPVPEDRIEAVVVAVRPDYLSSLAASDCARWNA